MYFYSPEGHLSTSLESYQIYLSHCSVATHTPDKPVISIYWWYYQSLQKTSNLSPHHQIFQEKWDILYIEKNSSNSYCLYTTADIIAKRSKSLYEKDRQMQTRISADNKTMNEIYDEFFIW